MQTALQDPAHERHQQLIDTEVSSRRTFAIASPWRWFSWGRQSQSASFPEVVHAPLSADDVEAASVPQNVQLQRPALTSGNIVVNPQPVPVPAQNARENESLVTVVIGGHEQQTTTPSNRSSSMPDLHATSSGLHHHTSTSSADSSSAPSSPVTRQPEQRQWLLGAASTSDMAGGLKMPRAASVASASGGASGSSGSSGTSNGVCLICLDALSPADFESGSAMLLECKCKGDAAMRHRECAIKWSQVKGSTICDVCRSPITNLPPVEALAASSGDAIATEEVPSHSEQLPDAADYIFDCIRITWITMIGCILFFEFTMTRSFFTGVLVGIMYTAMRRAAHLSQRRSYMNAQNGGEQPPPGMVLV